MYCIDRPCTDVSGHAGKGSTMTQKDLFIFDDLPLQSVELIELSDGEILWVRHFYAPEKCNDLLEKLTREIPWRQDNITIAGKSIPIPRLQAWFGDEGMNYSYSGLKLEPVPWSPELAAIKQDIESYCDTHFNSLLANLYRDNQDSVSWHSDDEKELGVNPTIASFSLGGCREFQLKHRAHQDKKLSIDLGNGDLLIMKGALQHNWLHCVPKKRQHCEPRINLTFRQIVTK